MDLSGKVNAIILAYALKSGFQVYYTNIKAQKIYRFTVKIFEMILTSLKVEDKLKRAPFF